MSGSVRSPSRGIRPRLMKAQKAETEKAMPSETQRVVTAAAAIVVGSVASPVGAIIGAAAVDYAAQKLAKRKPSPR